MGHLHSVTDSPFKSIDLAGGYRNNVGHFETEFTFDVQDKLLYDGFIFMLLRNDTLKLFNWHLYF